MQSPRTYSALYLAAKKIGANAYKQQLAEHVVIYRRKASTFRYDPPQCQRDIVAAMGNRTMSDNDAMALLWTYEAQSLRF